MNIPYKLFLFFLWTSKSDWCWICKVSRLFNNTTLNFNVTWGTILILNHCFVSLMFFKLESFFTNIIGTRSWNLKIPKFNNYRFIFFSPPFSCTSLSKAHALPLSLSLWHSFICLVPYNALNPEFQSGERTWRKPWMQNRDFNLRLVLSGTLLYSLLHLVSSLRLLVCLWRSCL